MKVMKENQGLFLNKSMYFIRTFICFIMLIKGFYMQIMYDFHMLSYEFNLMP